MFACFNACLILLTEDQKFSAIMLDGRMLVIVRWTPLFNASRGLFTYTPRLYEWTEQSNSLVQLFLSRIVHSHLANSVSCHCAELSQKEGWRGVGWDDFFIFEDWGGCNIFTCYLRFGVSEEHYGSVLVRLYVCYVFQPLLRNRQLPGDVLLSKGSYKPGFQPEVWPSEVHSRRTFPLRFSSF